MEESNRLKSRCQEADTCRNLYERQYSTVQYSWIKTYIILIKDKMIGTTHLGWCICSTHICVFGVGQNLDGGFIVFVSTGPVFSFDIYLIVLAAIYELMLSFDVTFSVVVASNKTSTVLLTDVTTRIFVIISAGHRTFRPYRTFHYITS